MNAARDATNDHGNDADRIAKDESPRPPAEPVATSETQPVPYPDPVDDTLDDSFPASDPPPWWGR